MAQAEGGTVNTVGEDVDLEETRHHEDRSKCMENGSRIRLKHKQDM